MRRKRPFMRTIAVGAAAAALWAVGAGSAAASALPAPTNVTVASASGSVTVTWDAVAGAAGYDIVRTTTINGAVTTTTASTVGTSYFDGSVPPPDFFTVTYSYTVTAKDASGSPGATSDPAVLTVSAANQPPSVDF